MRLLTTLLTTLMLGLSTAGLAWTLSDQASAEATSVPGNREYEENGQIEAAFLFEGKVVTVGEYASLGWSTNESDASMEVTLQWSDSTQPLSLYVTGPNGESRSFEGEAGSTQINVTIDEPGIGQWTAKALPGPAAVNVEYTLKATVNSAAPDSE